MKNLIYLFSFIAIIMLSCDNSKTSESDVSAHTGADRTDGHFSSEVGDTISKPSGNKGPNLSGADQADADTLETIIPGEDSLKNATPPVGPDTSAVETSMNPTSQNEEMDELDNTSGSLGQEQFAQIPAELSHRIVSKELPTVTDVGIKPYPNSYIIKLNNKTKYRDKYYVIMELASSDNPENILEFYQKRRNNWFYIENSAVHTFKKDKDKYFRETNTLQILPFDKAMYNDIDSLLSFDAKTLIRIYYEIPEEKIITKN